MLLRHARLGQQLHGPVDGRVADRRMLGARPIEDLVQREVPEGQSQIGDVISLIVEALARQKIHALL